MGTLILQLKGLIPNLAVFRRNIDISNWKGNCKSIWYVDLGRNKLISNTLFGELII